MPTCTQVPAWTMFVPDSPRPGPWSDGLCSHIRKENGKRKIIPAKDPSEHTEKAGSALKSGSGCLGSNLALPTCR